MSRLFREVLGEPIHRSHMARSGPVEIRRGAPFAPPAPGHGARSGPLHFHCEDRNAEVLARRARWRLYADCERAPIDWEKRA